ncbi:unnamed protein product [Dimorphilus gyrociliatus]|uniref:G-protein coupled receptors family 1 profile domain-containing protein n=1 Tax=Dimorphilus gyrociliatus TaxID=2664684 RepID=A0A7I8V5I5_9ANNE|nr:unnamed protein product [Dimorphilus gyrociliatus]
MLNSTPPTPFHQNGTEKVEIGNRLWRYMAPVIFFTGLIGNAIILLVMRRKRMGHTSTSLYLRFIATADLLVLVFGMIPEWLEASDIVIFKTLHPATCKIEKFAHYSVNDTATWFLVAFSFDRFIAVKFPLHKKVFGTARRIKSICTAIVLLSMAKNIEVFWTRGFERVNEDYRCGSPTQKILNYNKNVRPYLVFTLAVAVPLLVISSCNLAIIWTLYRQKTPTTANVGKSQSRTRIMTQMTLMCVSVSFAFIICITPTFVMYIGKQYWRDRDWYDVAKAVSNQLLYVNNSINFFLYFATGTKFRIEVFVLFGGRRQIPVVCRTSVPTETSVQMRTSRQSSSPRTGLLNGGSRKLSQHFL